MVGSRLKLRNWLLQETDGDHLLREKVTYSPAQYLFFTVHAFQCLHEALARPHPTGGALCSRTQEIKILTTCYKSGDRFVQY